MSSFNLLAAHARVAHAVGADDLGSEGAAPSCTHVPSVKHAYPLGSPPFIASKGSRGGEGVDGHRPASEQPIKRMRCPSIALCCPALLSWLGVHSHLCAL
jgi:hypothetical protein